MQYVMDAQGNYVKKPRRALEQPEPEREDEPERQHGPEIQPKAPTPDPPTHDLPAQVPSIPPLLALSDTQSIILDELIHLRQMMLDHFDQIKRRLGDLETTIEAMFDEV